MTDVNPSLPHLSAGPQRFGRPSRAADGLLTGVSAGLARRFSLETTLVRIAFVTLALTGVGVLFYVGAFLVMRSTEPIEFDDDWPTENSKVLGLALLVWGLVVLLGRTGSSLIADEYLWPILLVAAGFGVVSWQLGDGRRGQFSSAIQGDSRYGVLRIVGGGVVVALGIVAALLTEVSLSTLGGSLFVVVFIVGGLAVVFGPWIYVLLTDLADERRKRVRSDERADLAAHLHDSVLQTLALIQRTDDPLEAASLARRQERELRSWLYARPESFVHAEVDLTTLFESAVSDVEERHRVPIELVVVGDVVVDDSVVTLAKAAREAMVNASKFSGSSQVSVFVEGDEGQIEVWVRDRGQGFDPDTIGSDRRGIRDSIVRRVERIGGTSTITSEPGEGTEVYLILPAERKAAS